MFWLTNLFLLAMDNSFRIRTTPEQKISVIDLISLISGEMNAEQ